MTVTTTYLNDLSRVRVEFSGAPAAADFAIVERSTDQITWSVVRGGDEVAVTSGAGHLDDYEFSPGVQNFYRVSYKDTGPMSMVPAAGTAVTGNNTSLTPALPASGLLPGDLLLCYASIRNTSAHPLAPNGWTLIVDLGNARVFAKRYVTGDVAPTVTFTGGATGDDTLAQCTAFHNAELFPVTQAISNNTSAQNITLPSVVVSQVATLNLWLAWKQDDWTSAADSRGFAEIGDWFSIAGSSAAMWWEYTVQGPANQINFAPATLAVTGGAAAISTGASIVFQKAASIIQETSSITPNMPVAWIKNPRRPNLNTSNFTVVDWSDITRPARAGVFDVISRTMPIAVTDVRGSRRYTLTVTTKDLTTADDLDARLSQGDPILLHVPANAPFPGGYYVVGDISINRHSKRTLRRFFDLPLTEVAAPPGTVYSQTATYADIAAAYATYSDLLANEPQYSDVLDYVAPASDIITN